MPIILKRLEITAGLAGRADGAVRTLTGLSRSQVRGLFDHGCVSVNGEPCDANGVVKTGDVLEARFDTHRRYHARAPAWRDEAFEIVFEDQHVIVVNKSAGILTVPARPGETNTVVHAIARYFAQRGIDVRPEVVQRLDRDVSGLLVFGKSAESAAALENQFEARKPEREYTAIVHGVVPARGRFESRLATARNLQRHSTQRPGEGELAITHFELQKVVRGASWVRVWLETGRRNQIRVHFAEAGHPVLGDERYRPDLSKHPRWRVKRLALHAMVLGFKHPITGKVMRFETPMPASMRAFVKK